MTPTVHLCIYNIKCIAMCKNWHIQGLTEFWSSSATFIRTFTSMNLQGLPFPFWWTYVNLFPLSWKALDFWWRGHQYLRKENCCWRQIWEQWLWRCVIYSTFPDGYISAFHHHQYKRSKPQSIPSGTPWTHTPCYIFNQGIPIINNDTWVFKLFWLFTLTDRVQSACTLKHDFNTYATVQFWVTLIIIWGSGVKCDYLKNTYHILGGNMSEYKNTNDLNFK